MTMSRSLIEAFRMSNLCSSRLPRPQKFYTSCDICIEHYQIDPKHLFAAKACWERIRLVTTPQLVEPGLICHGKSSPHSIGNDTTTSLQTRRHVSDNENRVATWHST